MLAPYFSHEVDQYLKVSVLAVHVFCVQFGLQSLSGQLTDILLPSNSKAIMKGVIRAIQALTLLVFVTIMKQFEEHWSFWIMAKGLICVSPLLDTFIPELKNLGRTSGEFFFLPSQTLFYVVLPLNDAKKKWKNAINKAKAMVLFSKGIQKKPSQLEVPSNPQEKWWHWKSFEVISNKNKNITLFPDTMDTIRYDERNKELWKRCSEACSEPKVTKSGLACLQDDNEKCLDKLDTLHLVFLQKYRAQSCTSQIISCLL